MAADAVVGGRLGLPRTVEDIDAGVLSKVMGTTVRSVRVLDRDAGTSSRARLVLTGKDVPESVFVKVAAQDRRHPPDGGTWPARAHRGALLQPTRAATQRCPECLRCGIRHLDGPVPVGSGRPARRVVRISRHLAPAFPRPGQPHRRIAGHPARHLLGPPAARRSRPAGMALHAVGRRHLPVDRLADARRRSSALPSAPPSP